MRAASAAEAQVDVCDTCSTYSMNSTYVSGGKAGLQKLLVQLW